MNSTVEKSHSICVMGLGQVGLPVLAYVKERGLKVVGFDIAPDTVEKARKDNMTAYSDWQDVPKCDVYIICVGTYVRRNRPELSAIRDALSRIGKDLASDTLVSIESTVPVGTCRDAFERILRSRSLLIHVPHRYWVGDTVNHGVRQLRVLGAIDDRSIIEGSRFYSDILGIPLHIVPSIETAEACKVAENAYRFLQIAFAEELSMACQELCLDFDQVRKACNTKWNLEILEAREGVGGHCLPKDARYLCSMSRHSVMLKAAIDADRRYIAGLSSKKDRPDIGRGQQGKK